LFAGSSLSILFSESKYSDASSGVGLDFIA